MNTEARKVSGPECGPQVTHTALLASPGYAGQVQGRRPMYERRKPRGRASLLFASFGPARPHAYRVCFPLFAK